MTDHDDATKANMLRCGWTNKKNIKEKKRAYVKQPGLKPTTHDATKANMLR